MQSFSIAAKGYDLQTLREAVTLTCTLMLAEQLRIPSVASTSLVSSMDLCGHEDVEVARQACRAIANVAEFERTRKMANVNK